MNEPTVTPTEERSDEDVMLREFQVVLGGEEHTVTVKSIKESKEYRRILARVIRKLMVPLINLEDLERANMSELAGVALEAILVDGIDAFPELLAAYAPELNEQIESASDEEIIAAMSEVLEVTFPLVLDVGKLAFKLMSGSGMFAEMMRTPKKKVSPSQQR
jgi:hypothetical protein